MSGGSGEVGVQAVVTPLPRGAASRGPGLIGPAPDAREDHVRTWWKET